MPGLLLRPQLHHAPTAAPMAIPGRQTAPLPTRSPVLTGWSPSSWKTKKIDQDIVYPDEVALHTSLEKIKRLPALVSVREIEAARNDFARAALGEAFIIQGGDCAEAFCECTEENIKAKLQILLQMSLIIFMGAKVPVVRVGRIAGQYAKPRSKLTEVVNGVEYPSFRGDSVNGVDLNDRQPDPDRLLQAYFHSSSTLNVLRSVSGEEEIFSAALQELSFDVDSISSDVLREKAHQVHNRLSDVMLLYAAPTRRRDSDPSRRSLERIHDAMGNDMLWTSHEALNLPLEEASTRIAVDTATNEAHAYDTSAHMIWTGERTRQLDGAHIEFMRGIRNPIGVKVGPTMQPEELVQLLHRLDPNREAGRVTLITRMGVNKIERYLPALIAAVQQSGHQPVWLCDPCHGNGKTTAAGVKTRDFADIFGEIERCIGVHTIMGNALGGLHLELTGDDVTECTGGCNPLSEAELLGDSYKTLCDPRLSAKQSLHLAFLISRRLEGDNLHSHLSSCPSTPPDSK